MFGKGGVLGERVLGRGYLGEGVFGRRGKAQKNHWSKNMTPTWV